MRLTYHVETFRYAYPALSHYTTPLLLILVSLNRLAKLQRFLLKLQNVCIVQLPTSSPKILPRLIAAASTLRTWR